MKSFFGIPVSPGIVIGKAFVQETEGFRIPQHFIDETALETEAARFHAAVKQAEEEIASNRDAAHNVLGKNFADIFEAQLAILLDPKLFGEVETLILSQRFTAEHAVTIVMGKHINIFRQMKSAYIAEKVNDILDIEKRLLRHLLGTKKETFSHLTSPVVLMTKNLTPSETASLDKQFILAIVTETGGPGGHTAILAAALEIPCVVGAAGSQADAHGGDKVIVDGNSGTVIVRPNEEVQDKYSRLIDAHSSRIEILDSMRDLKAITKDGVRIAVQANIEFPHEAANAVKRGAEGIGLFRTEFLYLTQAKEPTEEEHFSSYKQVLDLMPQQPVVIRTFDIGDDKIMARYYPAAERNPALGLRGIRLALKRWDLFRCQLRAILRASAFGDVRIMFPLVSTVKEFRQAKRTALREVMDELRESKVPFNENIPVGMMVEVPSAVIMLDKFAEDADFFSIGTNDLVQYTMAVDRSNSEVSHLFCAEDPAVLRLLSRVVNVSRRRSIPVSLCGQMGGNPQSVAVLLGLGLRSVSCAPSSVNRVKQICRHITIKECEEFARRAVRMSSARDIMDYVRNKLRRIAPEIFSSDL